MEAWCCLQALLCAPYGLDCSPVSLPYQETSHFVLVGRVYLEQSAYRPIDASKLLVLCYEGARKKSGAKSGAW